MLFNINISALPLVSKQSGRCSLPFVPNTYKKRPILLMPMEVLAPGSGHADPPLGPHGQKFSGPRVWSGGDTKLFIHSSFSLFKWRLLPKLPGRALNVLAVRLTLHHHSSSWVNFHSCRWGSLLPVCARLTPSTRAENCLQSNIQTSPPTPLKSR